MTDKINIEIQAENTKQCSEIEKRVNDFTSNLEITGSGTAIATLHNIDHVHITPTKYSEIREIYDSHYPDPTGKRANIIKAGPDFIFLRLQSGCNYSIQYRPEAEKGK
ncbi:MAG: hypothetical protein KAU20_00315 [Nanoarchaeota archaeon]|nr:hypothetical protein [Nanoarchaeota archaeon]